LAAELLFDEGASGETHLAAPARVGRQFDEDQNTRAIPAAALTEAGLDVTTEPGLPGYRIVDITASRAIGKYVEVFIGAQNLFNTEYFVGTLPTTIGSPRLVNGGVRIRFMGRCHSADLKVCGYYWDRGRLKIASQARATRTSASVRP
jgi:hypothetical protein